MDNIKILTNQDHYDPFIADVYSLGLVLLKMMGYQNPKKEIQSDFLNLKTSQFSSMEKIIRLMVQEDPLQRADFKQLYVLISYVEGDISDIKPSNTLYGREKTCYEKWRNREEGINNIEN